MTILVIDNYDSFTFNLVHYLAELGAETIVVRNDALTTQDAMSMHPEAILLSPGPCTPNEAGICLALIEAAAETRTPLFGVCLGHQALGQAFGGIVERAPQVMHGKVSAITHDGTGVFAGIPPSRLHRGVATQRPTADRRSKQHMCVAAMLPSLTDDATIASSTL